MLYNLTWKYLLCMGGVGCTEFLDIIAASGRDQKNGRRWKVDYVNTKYRSVGRHAWRATTRRLRASFRS